MTLRLPFPPSVNHYWRATETTRKALTAKARAFRANALAASREQGAPRHSAAARLRAACAAAEQTDPLAPARADPSGLDARVAGHRERFLAAMDDDLRTPAAMRELQALADLCLETDELALRTQAGWMVRELGARILGLRLAGAHSASGARRPTGDADRPTGEADQPVVPA